MTTELGPPACTGTTPVTVCRVSDPETWARLRTDWNLLFDSSPTAAAPLHWDWLQTWWDVYGPAYVGGGRGRMQVLTVYRDGRLIGGLPLYQSRVGYLTRAGGANQGPWRLAFLGTDEAAIEDLCAEYLDLLHAPHEQEACAAAVAAELFGPWQPQWDELLLNHLSVHSPLLPALRDVCRKGRPTVSKPLSCPIADLTDGFEAYLSRVSSKRRRQFRRLLRDADRVGAVFEVATGASEAAQYLDELASLHQQRWTSAGLSGCFASSRFERFHHELVRRWAPSGRAILGRMCIAGQTHAVLYGFRCGGKFDYYQAGVIPRPILGLESPGIAALLMFIRYLAQQGVTCFDFLGGASYYKTRMSTGELAITCLTIRRPTLRMGSYLAFDFIRRGIGKCRRVAGRLFRRDVRLGSSIDMAGNEGRQMGYMNDRI